MSNISGDTPQIVQIPPGVAHGYLALGETNLLTYLVDAYYDGSDELGVRYDSLDFFETLMTNLPAPERPILSERDSQLPRLCDLGEGALPVWSPIPSPSESESESESARIHALMVKAAEATRSMREAEIAGEK